MTLLTAAECRDKAEQKMAEAANNPALRQGLIETAKAWLELADKIEQAEALEAQAKGKQRGRAMAKMLHLLLDWEYPHWMMMAGAILVAAGFIGLAFHRNRNGPVNEPSRALESTPTERLEAMRESASASADSQLKAKEK